MKNHWLKTPNRGETTKEAIGKSSESGAQCPLQKPDRTKARLDFAGVTLSAKNPLGNNSVDHQTLGVGKAHFPPRMTMGKTRVIKTQ